MTLTPARIVTWYRSVERLDDVASALRTVSIGIDELFDSYVADVAKADGVYWEGKAATAAQDRAREDRATVAALTDRLKQLGIHLVAHCYTIYAPLRSAYIALEALQASKFQVGSDIRQITDPTPSAARKHLLAELADDLATNADAAERADATLAEMIGTAVNTMRALFVSAETLGADEGRDDARTLVADPRSLKGEQLQRLIAAGTLTPRQLTDWRAGREVHVPLAQMAYLNCVSRAFDGSTPEEINYVLDLLPANVRHAVAQSFQIIGSSAVTTGVSAAGTTPVTGGAKLLPSGVRHALTRPDLVTKDIVQVDTAVLDAVRLNGVCDNQAVADIVAAAGDKYKQGSDLDRLLMHAGRQYLHAQVRFDQDKSADVLFVDGHSESADRAVAEPIFRALGPDKAALEHELADRHAGATGGDFVTDLITHRWSDDGRAASSLFQFAPGTETPADNADSGQLADARRMGHIMSFVGHDTSSASAWQLISDIPGIHQTAGRLNPYLLRTLAGSMSPFVNDLAGGPEHPGFDTSRDMTGPQPQRGFTHTWIDPDDNSSYRGSANVFALMNTDPTARRGFAAIAIAEILHSEVLFAKNPTQENLRCLTVAGTLHGLVDKALQQQLQAQYHDDAEHANDIYDVKVQAYNMAKALLNAGVSIGGNVSGLSHPGQLVNGLSNAYSDPIQDWLCGPPPPPERQAHVPTPNFDQDAQAILAARQARNLPLPVQWQHQYPWAFDADDHIIPFTAATTDEHQNQHAYSQMLTQLAGADAIAAMKDAYRTVREPPN